MTKRHTNQNHKQKNGVYYTSNADNILAGYEHLIKGQDVVDPFAGNGDLLNWAKNNGCNSISGYDINPSLASVLYNDSIMNPIDYGNKFVLSNPPYLNMNKAKGDKLAYIKWGMNDLYKCHLMSLYNVNESIQILPGNFLSERNSKARDKLFETHHIVSGKYWTQPSFEDTTTCICVLHIKKGRKENQQFPLLLMPDNITVDVELLPENGYLHGREWFDYINIKPITVKKVNVGDKAPNTNIVVGLLDNGAWGVGLSYNENTPIYCKPKSFTTYQITLPDYSLSVEEQKQVILLFNDRLQYYRKKYNSLFLANYMGPNQKILSRQYIDKLLSKCLLVLNINPINTIGTLPDFIVS